MTRTIREQVTTLLDYSLVLGVAEKAYGLLDDAKTEAAIEAVWKGLVGTYQDVAQAHFKAARQAVASARRSRAPEQELRQAIGHLRAAFNTYEALLTKTRTERLLFFIRFEVDILQYLEKDQVSARLVEIAALIHALYRRLGEPGNASQAKDTALPHRDAFVRAVIASAHSGEHLYRTKGQTYAIRRTNVERITIDPSGYNSREVTPVLYELTPHGEEYVDRKRRQIQSDFDRMFPAT